VNNHVETVSCAHCGTQTPMLGTKRCDRCWELEKRIERDPALAAKIVQYVQAQIIDRLILSRPRT
jgi:hypothetical protein